jgi:histidyl-tRNA synthetase
MTPTLARMVAARANALRKPIRWFSMPQLFRYERQQKGRLREHFQLNVDIIGEESVAADAELLAVSLEIMRAFGLTASDVRARVSDRRLLAHILTVLRLPEEAHARAFGVIDKVERQPRGVSEKKLEELGMDTTAVKRLLDGLSIRSLLELGRHFPEATDDGQSLASLTTYFEYLEQLGVSEWVELDLSIVRGLAYYTGIVFELFDRKGELRAICGGGRYDTLLKAAGGPDLKALGFGMGDVVLGELLRARKLVPPYSTELDYWVADSGGAVSGRAMHVASALRRQKHSAEYALREQPLARQLKTAATLGAAKVVILHGDNDATIRTLADGAESRVQLDTWLQSANV